MRFVGLVIDGKTGIPKFDDPKNAPPEMKAMLTDDHIMKMPVHLLRDLDLLDKRIELETRGN